MMNFASMKFFLVGLTLTAMLSACSDDETSDLIPEPSISISALESEIGALNFSINVENAEQCAYVCMNANESLPTTADEIFATGTSIKLTDKNKLSIRVPVDKQITYAVIAAAANQTGKTISNKLHPAQRRRPRDGRSRTETGANRYHFFNRRITLSA